MLEYGDAMDALLAKQANDENYTGTSTAPLHIAEYWAIFLLCSIIKDEVVSTEITQFSSYDSTYNLTRIGESLQLKNIDITKVYAIFALFGYSMGEIITPAG
jgi:hypothetical protein